VIRRGINLTYKEKGFKINSSKKLNNKIPTMEYRVAKSKGVYNAIISFK
jgi:hypothetical protein